MVTLDRAWCVLCQGPSEKKNPTLTWVGGWVISLKIALNGIIWVLHASRITELSNRRMRTWFALVSLLMYKHT